jgi:PAS domain S-box-containing protein
LHLVFDGMKKYIFCCLVFLAFGPGCSPATILNPPEKGKPVVLTKAEIEWIRTNPVVLSAPDPDFPPAEFFDESGQYRGLVADYLEIISKRVGLELEIIRLDRWADVLDHARQKRIQLVTAASKTLPRVSFLDFSKPFVALPAVIIVRRQASQELTLDELKGMTISVVYQYAVHDYLVENYPDLKLDFVSDIQTGLRKVSFGIVDAMVANIASVSYYIEKGTLTNLKVAGESGFTYNLSFAPRKDLPILTDILNKGLDSLGTQERHQIYSKWIRLEQPNLLTKKMLLSLGILLGVVCLFITIVLVWNRSLRINVDDKTRELKREVVEHEQAKKASVESEIRYRGIFEYTKSGVIIYEVSPDGKDFICVDLNQSAEKIDNLKSREIIGKGIGDIFPNIQAFGLLSTMQKVVASGTPLYFPTAWYEDGRIEGWRDYFVYKLPSSEIVTVYSDETDRKVAETALRESEETLAGIIHSVNDHMVMLDEQLNILWANNIVKKIFGDHLEDKKCYELFAGLSKPCDNCIAELCFRDGLVKEREIKLEKGKGPRLDFWETTNPISLNQKGLPKTIVVIFRDITQRKALVEESMRSGRLASIGELAAGVAHEINNPINSVINLAQIILNREKKKGHQHDIALRMIDEGTRIAEIVRSLLAFSRDNQGAKKLLHPRDIVLETLALTKVQIVKNGINLDLDLPPDLPMIFGHMQQLQQVFLNLINNARFALNDKTFPKDSLKRIKIYGRGEQIEGKAYIRIVFEDNGTGIPDKLIDRIMDPFFTTKPENMGTGLGLSISHGIINDHKGRMEIQSKDGEFTRFIIDLPRGDG